METQPTEVIIVDLTNSSITLSQSNSFTSALQSHIVRESISPKNRPLSVGPHHLQFQVGPDHILPQNQSGNLLTIRFNLVQLNPLTALQPQIRLFELNLPMQFTLKCDLKLSKLFQLDTLSYFMQIQTALLKQDTVQTGYVTVKTQKFTTFLNHRVQINFPSKQSFVSTDSSQCTLLLGNQHNKWSFAVQNLKIIQKSTQTSTIFPNEQQKPIIQNLSLPQDYSYPLIDTLELPLSDNTNLSQKIQSLQKYSSPKLSSKSRTQFYICHDMKGGYIQDINTFTPQRSDDKTHHYRFNYLNQTQIFNYFSHYPITIPPQMWRSLCKNYHVICLGTFIVEPNDLTIDETQFLTEEFALKLVFIAKKAQFDGYLINIQVPIRNPIKLISWLDFLTNSINKAIPGSQIIWYDSVIIDGQLAYQNEVNPLNKAFYQVCNGMFTNYWWKQQSLKNCLKHKIPSKSIFIGNDCFGRNTYGGGKYQIVKAVSKIQQMGKGELGIGLFAPGYTYEDEAEQIRQNFNQNQIKMYHGSSVDSRKIEKWKLTQNGGQGWKNQDDWAVTSYDLCKREALVKISDYKAIAGTLVINFSCFVAGTGPKYSDYYKITLQVIDYKNNHVHMELICPSNTASQKEQYIQTRLEIQCSLITENICVRILEEGKDSEHWAGHYGSRFKGETVALILSKEQTKWITSIPLSPTSLKSKYNTFFNKGEGDHFYFFGKKQSPNYSSLTDFDIPPLLTLNNISTVQISYADSYIGGTCLKFQNTNQIRLNSFQLDSTQSSPRKYTVLLVSKQTEPLQIVCGTVKGLFKQLDVQGVEPSIGWKTFTTELVFPKEIQSFIAEVTFTTKTGFLGQFTFFQSHISEPKPADNLFKLTITLNKQSKILPPYRFDVIVNSKMPSNSARPSPKLLLKLSQFSGFINLTSSKAKDTNQTSTNILGMLNHISVPVQKTSEVQIQVLYIDAGIPKILISNVLQKHQLKQILQNIPLIYTFYL